MSLEAACGQSSVRVISAPVCEAPARHNAALLAASDKATPSSPGAGSEDLFDELSAAVADGTPPPAIQREPLVADAPRALDVDNYGFAAVMPNAAAQPWKNAEPLALDAASPREIPLTQRQLRVAAAAPQADSAAKPAQEPGAAAPRLYLGDAISAGSGPCCNDQMLMPYGGCPYYPHQSGTHAICGVDCGPHGAACCETWKDARWIPWSLLGPGEYVGPPRPEHVPAYYLRVNDLITLTYIVSRQKQADQYHIGVGDRLRVESSFDETLDRELIVQPDGDINLPLIGDVPAAGKTIKELREDLIRRFGRIEREPVITVTPLEVNLGLREILNAVTSQSRLSGQAIDLRVTPEGTIQAPGLGSVYVQGLAIEELRSELEARYAAMFGPGLLVSPALSERATSYVFIGGEVASPGRYTLEGPTTVMQAIALAGGWNNGGNTREVVVFRRDENWCLKATKINVHRPLYGKDPCPVDDVWLRDNDLVIVPKSRILCAADVVELYFTRGVYAVFPITFVKDFSTGSTIAPVGP
jgi:polysaccharide export outer membrane protein